jgi:hypothetical protein
MVPLAVQADYGPVGNLVATAGTLVAVVGALALAWRGRGRWEPSEEDISTGPQRVAGLVAVAGLVLLWVRYHNSPDAAGLPPC